MPTVTFLPSNKTVDIKKGAVLIDAAKEAGIHAEAPCGGKGLCKKCIAQVVSGTAVFENNGALPDELIREGYVLLCRAKAGDDPLEIRILTDLRTEKGKFSAASEDLMLVDDALKPHGKPTPLVRPETLDVPPPALGDGLSDADRLAKTAGMENDVLPLSVLKTLPEILRKKDGRVTVYRAGDDIIDIVPGEGNPGYGVAVDIGTTTVAVHLVDMDDGDIIASKTEYNAQVACGLDIISRIHYAKSEKHLHELQHKVLATINGIISKLADTCGIGHKDIRNAVVAGNTTMIHLFLGIIPEYIRLDPYTPAVYSPPRYKAGEIGLSINPETPVFIVPGVGSYVGGDIVSGLLCTPVAAESEELSLFIDIGTNGEMVLGNRDFLIGCACSAGPAFEGGGIEKGMRASTGAIERVTVDLETGLPAYAVIGDTAPKGICGSGMIGLVAELFKTGWLDPAGKLNRVKKSEAIRIEGKTAHYMLTEDVYVTESDIDNLIRAKAAIFSAGRVLIQKVGMEFADIAKVYIAGGFGRYLDTGNAREIGLIPNLPADKYVFLGNTSLSGTTMALVSKTHREKIKEIAKQITYIDLGLEPEYMHEYTAALFLPHTDERLFLKNQ